MNLFYSYIKLVFVILTVLACLVFGSACRAELGIMLDSSTVSFGTIDKSVLDAGYMELTSSPSTYVLRVTVTDTVTENWTLYTKASSSHFTASVGVKPCGDLQWRQNGNGAYTEFSVFDAVTATGIGNSTVDFDFKLLTSWSDRPDSYSIDVVFTISN